MLNAAVNRLTASGSPMLLTIDRWSEVAHLQETGDELLT